MTTEQPHTPSPAHRPSERTFHGDTVVDPFEWMRDKTDPEVIAHLEAENAYADARTAHLDALRGTLVEEFVGHTQETDLSVPVRRDDWWYIVRTTAGNDYPMFTRIADAGTLPQVEPGVMLEGEQVLLDAQAEAAGREFYSLGGLAPSPDHTLYASAVDTAGDERFTLRITDLTSGQVIDEAVTGAGYGLAFSADQQWLFYARVDDAWRQHQIWRHRIGSDASEDVLVIEEPDERFMIGFDRSRDGSTLVIQAGSTSTTEAWLLDLADPSSAPVPAGGRRDGVDMIHCWGMTETSPIGTVAHPPAGVAGQARAAYRYSQGRFPVGLEYRIVNDAGRALESHDRNAGELQVRGNTVAASYYESPSQTGDGAASVFRGEAVDDGSSRFTVDGWLRTGDIATVTQDGFLVIHDRKNDVIRSGGEWIYSASLENYLLAHPGVNEAAVIGIPDDKWGQRPLAVVVLAAGYEPTEETATDIRNSLLPQVPAWMAPENFSFVANIERTSVEKFDKKELRRLMRRGELDFMTLPDPDEEAEFGQD